VRGSLLWAAAVCAALFALCVFNQTQTKNRPSRTRWRQGGIFSAVALVVTLGVWLWPVIQTERVRSWCRSTDQRSLGQCEHKNDRNPFNLK
jgi:hypothetical protein